jgi:predicted Zn-dependent protease with MMP-like domain
MSDWMLSLEQYREEINRVLEAIPDQFRQRLGNVVFEIHDEPTAEDWAISDEVWQEQHKEDDLLFGLFLGIPLTEQEYGVEEPNLIKIFRRPHELVSETVDELRENIHDTVLHELAHHFGYSEEDLEEFERSRMLSEEEDPEPC